MKKILGVLVLSLIALPLSASAATSPIGQAMNTTWFQCHADRDCLPVQTACNKWEGVNKKYARDFKATVSKFGLQGTGCPPPAQIDLMKKLVRGQCLNNYCAAILPKTSP